MNDVYERLGCIEAKVDQVIEAHKDLQDVVKYVERQKGSISLLKYMIGALIGIMTAIGTVVAAMYARIPQV